MGSFLVRYTSRVVIYDHRAYLSLSLDFSNNSAILATNKCEKLSGAEIRTHNLVCNSLPLDHKATFWATFVKMGCLVFVTLNMRNRKS